MNIITYEKPLPIIPKESSTVNTVMENNSTNILNNSTTSNNNNMITPPADDNGGQAPTASLPPPVSAPPPPNLPNSNTKHNTCITTTHLNKFMKCIYKDMLTVQQMEGIVEQMMIQYSNIHSKHKHTTTSNANTNINTREVKEIAIELNEFYALLSSMDVLQLLSIHL